MSDLNPALQFQNRKRADTASGAANGSSVTGDTIDTKNYDIINSYNFVLRVEGFQNLPLKAVRGINKQNEYEYIQEGGLNDYVHMVRKPISQPFTFQVERYVAQGWLKDAIDPLANGVELMLPLVLYMYRSNAHDGTAPSRYYIFTNCRVTGVQIGDLDAEKSGLHTITNTIAYSQMTIITLPFLGIDDDGMYSFNKGNAENRQNTSHVRTLKDMGYTKMDKPNAAKDKGPEETDEAFAIRSASVDYRGNRSKEDMKSLSIKYKYRDSVKSANAKNVETAKSKEALEEEAAKRKYRFKPQITVTESGQRVASIPGSLLNPGMNLAVPTKIQPSKTMMKNEAAKRKYSVDNKNPGNLAEPYKTMEPKKDLEDKAKARKYSGKSEITGSGQRVAVIGNVAVSLPENLAKPYKTLEPKKDLEEKAAERKYSADNENPGNLATPMKDSLPKSTREEAAEVRKYKFKNGTKANNVHINANVDDKVKQVNKDDMKGKAKKYDFKRGSNGSAVKNESEIRKANMMALAEAYSSKPHYTTQKNEKAEVRNHYRFGDGPTNNVQLPLIQADKKMMEKAARKYPKTRSAKDVSAFLGRKK